MSKRPINRVIIVSMLVTVGALGSVISPADASAAPAGSGDCPMLAEGSNQVSPGPCFTLDVPEGTDLVRVWGFYTHGATLFDIARSSDPEQTAICEFGRGLRCAIPGPAVGPLYIHTGCLPTSNSWCSEGHFTFEIRYEEAIRVFGTVVDDVRDSVSTSGDGRMYRFDGPAGDAVVSLAGDSGVDVFLRRGTPPTFAEADCVVSPTVVQAERSYASVRVTAVVGSCRLDAAPGPVYAFVVSRHWPGFRGSVGDPIHYHPELNAGFAVCADPVSLDEASQTRHCVVGEALHVGGRIP